MELFQFKLDKLNSILESAKASMDAATTDSEREGWRLWIALLQDDVDFAQTLVDAAQATQNMLETEKMQLIEKITPNCKPLDLNQVLNADL